MYTKYNAGNVLIEVEKKIEQLTRNGGTFRIRDVSDELSIFDWWPDRIGTGRLKDMRKFLREAIKLGFTGYVCFKVGASGCANGMWAHKENSINGYSPDGPCLYKSFTQDYNCWQVDFGDGFDEKTFDTIHTIKELEAYIANHKEEVL